MKPRQSTCWTLIQSAAAGGVADREAFALPYGPILRRYLLARWRDSPLRQETEDAVQEVFLECYRRGGVLEKASPDHASGFRAFLYGAARNVACRFEGRKARLKEVAAGESLELEQRASGDPSLSRVFDKAWAVEIMRQARQVMRRRALEAGGEGWGTARTSIGRVAV